MDRQRLLDDLLRHLEAGSLDPEIVVPAIRALRDGEGEPPSPWASLRALDGLEGRTFARHHRCGREAAHRTGIENRRSQKEAEAPKDLRQISSDWA